MLLVRQPDRAFACRVRVAAVLVEHGGEVLHVLRIVSRFFRLRESVRRRARDVVDGDLVDGARRRAIGSTRRARPGAARASTRSRRHDSRSSGPQHRGASATDIAQIRADTKVGDAHRRKLPSTQRCRSRASARPAERAGVQVLLSAPPSRYLTR